MLWGPSKLTLVVTGLTYVQLSWPPYHPASISNMWLPLWRCDCVSVSDPLCDCLHLWFVAVWLPPSASVICATFLLFWFLPFIFLYFLHHTSWFLFFALNESKKKGLLLYFFRTHVSVPIRTYDMQKNLNIFFWFPPFFLLISELNLK